MNLHSNKKLIIISLITIIIITSSTLLYLNISGNKYDLNNMPSEQAIAILKDIPDVEIGDKISKNIIENRPYYTKQQLIDKAYGVGEMRANAILKYFKLK